MPTMSDKQWRKFEREQWRKHRREQWASKTPSQKAAIVWLTTIATVFTLLVTGGLFGAVIACNLQDIRHAWPVDVAVLVLITSWFAVKSLDK